MAQSPVPLLLTLALMTSSHLHPLAAIHQERVPSRHTTLQTLQTPCVLTSYDLISILFEFDQNAHNAQPLASPSLGIHSPDVSFIIHIRISGKPSLLFCCSGYRFRKRRGGKDERLDCYKPNRVLHTKLHAWQMKRGRPSV